MLTILHRNRVTTRAALPVLLAASLALGGCSQGAEPEPTTAVATTAASDPAAEATTKAGAEATATPSPSASASGKPATSGKPSGEGAPPDMAQGGPKTVVINVKGKNVDPEPGSIKIKKGEELLLVVITDQDGEVHVHGVDVEKETKARMPTQIPLTFDEKGSFEVELHDPELLLTKIVVS